jgi:SET domain-containing protein 6
MEIDSDANSRFLDGTRSFVNWFQALPGATFHNDIAVEDLRGRNAGRGISE